jgi:hypothetical protein
LTEVFEPDLCLIGAGWAGHSVATIGASPSLFERARRGRKCLIGGSPLDASVPIRAMEDEARVADHGPDAPVRLWGAP